MINTSQIGYIVRLLWLALGLLVAVHIFGTVVYMLLTEGKYSWFDCFYMTFITVATIRLPEKSCGRYQPMVLMSGLKASRTG